MQTEIEAKERVRMLCVVCARRRRRWSKCEREREGGRGWERDRQRERTSHERVVGGRWMMIKDKREGRSANGIKDFIISLGIPSVRD